MKRGIPNKLMDADNRTRKVHPSLVPTTEEAVERYRLSGGRISDPCFFGTDPLETNEELKTVRYEAFSSKFSFEFLFCEVTNGCGSSFHNALLFLIDITYRLSHSV